MCVRVGGWVWGCIFGIRMTQFEFCDNDIRVSKKIIIGSKSEAAKIRRRTVQK